MQNYTDNGKEMIELFYYLHVHHFEECTEVEIASIPYGFLSTKSQSLNPKQSQILKSKIRNS